MRERVRRAMAGTVTAVMVFGLGAGLSGCGDSGKSKSKSRGSSSHKDSDDTDSGSTGSGPGSSGEVQREVTLEVPGSGSSQVMYILGSNKMERVSLPWKLTRTLSLTKAEQSVGVLVSVVPGSVKGSDGMLEQAACRITVDGKTVVDQSAGSSKTCEYKVK
ncbi:hypothetical protein HUT18_32035 [Streptomyces sp. NA04227]|uniref:hypothetical protein n=1 Tax=Streptomyces sp. NA04227 TaxID=2742136 RepID=UPI00159075D3|nr:hypothetical protein [Streptomyces sp. NA04227]QKW10355.1 hypothetical protein HUT18_32035 [Streptomyces sp. NA04227]